MRKVDTVTTAHHRLHQTAEIEDNLVDKADLIALTGELAGKRFTIEQRIVLGRDPAVEIMVPGEDVSRRHAAIARSSAKEFVVEDLDSRNGTLVNGVPIEVHVLKFGDKLQIGSRTLFVFTPHSAPEEQLIRWQRIEAIGQMASGVVHDFANYMTAVLGQVEYLRRLLKGPSGLREETLARGLDDIHAAAQQAFKLTRKVLGFARSTESAAFSVDLGTVVEDALRLTARSCEAEIRIHSDIEDELTVQGDRTELLQVLINLLLNARDAMPGGGDLRVSARTTEGEAGDLSGPLKQVLLEVSDNGVGMDEQVRSRVFEPLFTTKPAGMGTGLGLSTVARIVEKHRGTIDVQSAPGQGTTFRIRLPKPG